MKALLSNRQAVSPGCSDKQIVKDIGHVLYDSDADLVTIELGSGTGSLSLYLYELLKDFANSRNDTARKVNMVVTDLGQCN